MSQDATEKAAWEIVRGSGNTVSIVEARFIARTALHESAEYIDHLETYLAGMGNLEHFKRVWAEGRAMKNGRQSTP